MKFFTGFGDKFVSSLFHVEAKYLRNPIRLVIFSKTGIPFATAVVNGSDVFDKPEMERTSIRIRNKETILLRFIKSDVFKATYFRVYSVMSTEIDDDYIWQGYLDFPRWCSGRGRGSICRFVPGDLRVTWN